MPKIILIGSWCLPMYKDFYFGHHEMSLLRTRDIDFLISRKTQFTTQVDLPALLEDLGFILEHSFPEGYVRLIHPELIVEFLVPEVGRGSSKPYPLPELGVNAQRLRFLELLEKDTIVVNFSGLKVIIPHPVNFGLHKILVSTRRTEANKKGKDLEAGLEVLRMCVDNMDGPRVVELFRDIPRKQQQKVIRLFEVSGAEDLLKIVNP
ncbi:MAG: hypothetical protein JRL30_15990 [Deltaproteobacteria bacterium]|nr:hypothetical protein [Deltaproteobacteria bacterium]